MIKNTIQALKQQPSKVVLAILFTIIVIGLDFGNRVYQTIPSLPVAQYSINTFTNTKLDISELSYITEWLEKTKAQEVKNTESEQAVVTKNVIETPLLTQGTNLGDKRVRLRAVFQQQKPKPYAFVLIEQQDITTRQISFNTFTVGDELAGYKLQAITSNSVQLVNMQQNESKIELLVFKN